MFSQPVVRETIISRVKSHTDVWSKYEYLYLTAILLIATVFRLYKLGEWSFWIDEVYSITDALIITPQAALDIRTHFFPISYLLIRGAITTLGVSEWSSRLIPALFGGISILVVYYMGKQLFNRPIAFLAATLLVVHPWHIYWSQNARYYTLLLVFCNLALFFFFRGFEQDRWTDIVAGLCFSALALLTHSTAVLIGIIIATYLVTVLALAKWFELPAGLHRRNIALMLSPLIALVCVDGILLVTTGSSVTQSMSTKFLETFFGEANLKPEWIVTGYLHYLGPPLVVLSGLGGIVAVMEKKRIGLFLSIVALVPVTLITLLSPFFFTAYRYAFISMLSWVLLAGFGLWRIRTLHQPMLIVIVWFFGVAGLFLNDTVGKDIAYYFGSPVYMVILAGLWVTAIGLLLFHLNTHLRHVYRYRIPSTLLFAVCFGIIIGHAVIASSFYFVYQQGWRDNWAGAGAILRSERAGGELAYSDVPILARFYLGDPVKSVEALTPDDIAEIDTPTWIVQTHGVDVLMGATFEAELASHCTLTHILDNRAAGRMWKMRIHLCGDTPIVE